MNNFVTRIISFRGRWKHKNACDCQTEIMSANLCAWDKASGSMKAIAFDIIVGVIR